jgi:hypothetical protein
MSNALAAFRNLESCHSQDESHAQGSVSHAPLAHPPPAGTPRRASASMRISADAGGMSRKLGRLSWILGIYGPAVLVRSDG